MEIRRTTHSPSPVLSFPAFNSHFLGRVTVFSPSISGKKAQSEERRGKRRNNAREEEDSNLRLFPSGGGEGRGGKWLDPRPNEKQAARDRILGGVFFWHRSRLFPSFPRTSITLSLPLFPHLLPLLSSLALNGV